MADTVFDGTGDVDYLGGWRLPVSLFQNIPSFAALGLGGYGLSKVLGLKKKWPLAAGLPAAYLAYLLGKKGEGGLDLYNGINIIDAPASAVNNSGHWAALAATDAAKTLYNGDKPNSHADQGASILDAWDYLL